MTIASPSKALTEKEIARNMRAVDHAIAQQRLLSELVNAKRGISAEMAFRLSKVFGGSAESWLVRQAQYELRICGLST